MEQIPLTRLPLALLLLTCAAALGNGGGYIRGGVERTGTVTGFEPKDTDKVRILDEQLTVTLGPGEAKVEVRYLMRNLTDSRVTVRFGFPIEESVDAGLGPEPEPVPDEPRKLRDYRLAIGGRPVKARFEAEPADSNPDRRFAGLAGWMVSEVKFAGGEEKPVHISYHSEYPASSRSVSDDEHSAARLFRYRLSTGACWAGTIARARVLVTTAGIDPAEVRVIKPVNRFRRDGNRWVWEFENLEPTLADDLVIEAAPEQSVYWRSLGDGHDGPWATYVDRGGRWLMSHRNYRATASSTLPSDGRFDYDAANLNDDDWDNAWSEGRPGPGVGEWIELEPQVPKPLVAIELRPGYTKSEQLFKSNCRPKRVLVLLNNDHEFAAEVPDRNEPCRIPVLDYSKPVRTVKLTFEEVWPGLKYEDLCVSGVALQVRLEQKPKVTPAR